MEKDFSIRVYKQYFNFSSSHFLLFEDGTREPLHGHNYRVNVKGNAPIQRSDMVFDFLDIKPIVREVCDSLDHRLLLPGENPNLKIKEDLGQLVVETPDKSTFSFPKQDVIILPIPNTSAERLAIYISYEIRRRIKKKFSFSFPLLEIEVEETPGQSAIFVLKESD
ncbi:MAG: 6-carboxytetrahydropterin synthase [Bdellovibrionota bacterium]|nr:6-carboxytetrahydropterin synthase [Bdellovibrionota bacterium]